MDSAPRKEDERSQMQGRRGNNFNVRDQDDEEDEDDDDRAGRGRGRGREEEAEREELEQEEDAEEDDGEEALQAEENEEEEQEEEKEEEDDELGEEEEMEQGQQSQRVRWEAWEDNLLIDWAKLHSAELRRLIITEGRGKNNKKTLPPATNATRFSSYKQFLLGCIAFAKERARREGKIFSRSEKSVKKRFREHEKLHNDWHAMKLAITGGQNPRTIPDDDPSVHPAIRKFREKHKNWRSLLFIIDAYEGSIFENVATTSMAAVRETGVPIDAQALRQGLAVGRRTAGTPAVEQQRRPSAVGPGRQQTVLQVRQQKHDEHMERMLQSDAEYLEMMRHRHTVEERFQERVGQGMDRIGQGLDQLGRACLIVASAIDRWSNQGSCNIKERERSDP